MEITNSEWINPRNVGSNGLLVDLLYKQRDPPVQPDACDICKSRTLSNCRCTQYDDTTERDHHWRRKCKKCGRKLDFWCDRFVTKTSYFMKPGQEIMGRRT